MRRDDTSEPGSPGQVEDRDPIAHRAQEPSTILREEDISLLVHTPAEVRELRGKGRKAESGQRGGNDQDGALSGVGGDLTDLIIELHPCSCRFSSLPRTRDQGRNYEVLTKKKDEEEERSLGVLRELRTCCRGCRRPLSPHLSLDN